MAEIYDDRRQATRFATTGEVELEIDGQQLRAGLIDLSIDGLKMRRPAAFGAPAGSRFALKLLLPEADAFTAEVVLLRADSDSVGVEFMDMPPRDFGLLAALIDRFAHLQAQALIQG
ncbi:MAG: PilZ domain-containing protein [Lysobacterales bacterium]